MRAAPALRDGGVQNGEGSGGDGEEDVDGRPGHLLLERPGEVRVRLLLEDLAHDGADTGEGADAEEEAEAEFLGGGHLDDVQDDEGDGEEGEFEEDMDAREGDAEWI